MATKEPNETTKKRGRPKKAPVSSPVEEPVITTTETKKEPKKEAKKAGEQVTVSTVKNGEKLGVEMSVSEIREAIREIILTTNEHFIFFHAGRNIGKTYTTQKTLIQWCYENQREFVFVVPTDKEKENKALKEYLSKVAQKEFKSWDFKFSTDECYCRKTENDDWQRLAVCVPLTLVERIYKKRNYPLVDWIICDEILISDPKMMNMMIDNVLLLYDTIDRREDRVKFICMGNDQDKKNPITDFFDISVRDLDAKNIGTVKRGNNKFSWYVPSRLVEEEGETAFERMNRGTRYGNFGQGIVDIYYGHLLKEPPEDMKVSCVYGLMLGDLTYMNILCGDDGYLYAESVTREFMSEYATVIFTTTFKQATDNTPTIPGWLFDYLRLALENGRFKFIDEESLTVLSPKMQAYFNLKILG